MAEIYPPGLRDVLVNGFTMVDQDRVQSNDVQIGPPRFELLSTSGPSFGGATWNFTRTDFQLFEAWHHLTLSDGARSFIMPVLVGAGFIDTEMFFNGPYKVKYFAKRVIITAKLLVVDKPFDDQQTLDELLGEYNTGNLFADLDVSATIAGTLTDG
jgi:hypothetical protein